MKTLVTYFSASGVTQRLAEKIAQETGGELYEIAPNERYTDADLNWMDKGSRSSVEMNDRSSRPAIASKVDNMAQYDAVFVGFPVWWYDLPMPMWTFLENYDFSGKTIIPFFSHEGSSNGASALPTIETLATGATVRSGDALSIRGGNVDGAENEVREWVRGLGLD